MEARRRVELTDTNSPFVLILFNVKLPSSLSIIYFMPNFFGGHRGEGTPDPIPNSEVKLSIADDTASLLWESRPPPKILLKKLPAADARGAFWRLMS